MPNDSKAPVMPYSPLDALINALSDVRKAGRVKPGDDVLSVQQRIADVFRPIVKRIQAESRSAALEEAAQAQCQYCRGVELHGLKPLPADWFDIGKLWRHRTSREDVWAVCEANRIRSLKGKNHA